MTELFIPGPAGPLEATLTEAAKPTGSAAVLCHPHPRFGGTMHDAVLDTVARALLQAGVTCLRFNFRGVGASAGDHDGAAEADDVVAAAQWLAESQQPQQVMLVGYSFGAVMAWQALPDLPEIARVLLIAPPVGTMPLPERTPTCAVDVFAGDADQFVDNQALDELAKATGLTVHTLVGADHFFSGQWQALEQQVAEALG